MDMKSIAAFVTLTAVVLCCRPAHAQSNCERKAADLDQSGFVDAGDISVMLLLFGQVDPCCGLNCDDGNPNTVDTCANGVCQNVNPCDDGLPCTIDSIDSKTGECIHTPRDCNDLNSCTGDSCDAVTGNCVHTPLAGATCNDGNACTYGDICTAGANCLGIQRNCNDNNPCTTDTCNPEIGCINTPIPGCSNLVQPSRMTALARCADTVCEIMPSCCSADWDAVCASVATTVDACTDAQSVKETLERADAEVAAQAELAAIDAMAPPQVRLEASQGR